MLAPLSWLKDYVDIDVTPKELEEKLIIILSFYLCGYSILYMFCFQVNVVIKIDVSIP